MHDICNKEIGTKTKREKIYWFDEECGVALEEKRKAYRAYIQKPSRKKWKQYNELGKMASKTCRRKKGRGAISS